MNEERNRRIRKFLDEWINFGTETIDEDVLIAAEGGVFTFAELQFECAMRVRAIIPNDWKERALTDV